MYLIKLNEETVGFSDKKKGRHKQRCVPESAHNKHVHTKGGDECARARVYVEREGEGEREGGDL